MKDLLAVLMDTLKAAISKFHSRKFIVWVVATVALFLHFITNDQWIMVTMAWSGIQGVLDFHGKDSSAQAVLNANTSKDSPDTNTSAG